MLPIFFINFFSKFHALLCFTVLFFFLLLAFHPGFIKCAMCICLQGYVNGYCLVRSPLICWLNYLIARIKKSNSTVFIPSMIIDGIIFIIHIFLNFGDTCLDSDTCPLFHFCFVSVFAFWCLVLSWEEPCHWSYFRRGKRPRWKFYDFLHAFPKWGHSTNYYWRMVNFKDPWGKEILPLWSLGPVWLGEFSEFMLG